MRLASPIAIACLAALLAMADSPDDRNLSGPLTYSKAGVTLAGKTTPWKNVVSIEEARLDPESLREQYGQRKAKASSASAHVTLGKWCRDNGLEEEAKAEYQAALDAAPDNEEARKAMGFASVKDKGWVPALEVYEERRKGVPVEKKDKMLELAAWCGDHALFQQRWDLILALLARDQGDRSTIRAFKPLADKRTAETVLHPPFAGRWKAQDDPTGHHQTLAFCVFAFDFVKVDEKGNFNDGSIRSLDHFYSYDQPILAAADGVVYEVVDHFNDLPPNVPGRFEEANSVVIQHTDREYTNYGHIRKGSATVKKGDKVVRGQEIARVGNSGFAGFPHLHFAVYVLQRTPEGQGVFVGAPYQFTGFKLVDANGTSCSVDVKLARPQENWTMLIP